MQIPNGTIEAGKGDLAVFMIVYSSHKSVTSLKKKKKTKKRIGDSVEYR